MGEGAGPAAAGGSPNHSDPSRVVVSGVEEFDRFYLREYPRMVALAYALSGSRWCAEEIAQEAFLRAHRSWKHVANYEKPGAWLRRVTTNLATSYVRRRLTEAKALGWAALGRRSALPPHPNGEAEVWSAVARLPRRQRQAFALRYLEDLSVGEIAALLELKESTVRTHLQRGRSTLARVLGEEWGT
jgi:RNA polymerase sigma factor (sigma-70 family)